MCHICHMYVDRYFHEKMTGISDTLLDFSHNLKIEGAIFFINTLLFIHYPGSGSWPAARSGAGCRQPSRTGKLPTGLQRGSRYEGWPGEEGQSQDDWRADTYTLKPWRLSLSRIFPGRCSLELPSRMSFSETETLGQQKQPRRMFFPQQRMSKARKITEIFWAVSKKILIAR